MDLVSHPTGHRPRVMAWGFSPPARRTPGCRCEGLLGTGAGFPLLHPACVTLPLLSRSVVIPARPAARGISLRFPGPSGASRRWARSVPGALAVPGARGHGREQRRSAAAARADAAGSLPACAPRARTKLTCSRLWICAMAHRAFLAHPEEQCSAVLPRIAFQMCWLWGHEDETEPFLKGEFPFCLPIMHELQI